MGFEIARYHSLHSGKLNMKAENVTGFPVYFTFLLAWTTENSSNSNCNDCFCELLFGLAYWIFMSTHALQRFGFFLSVAPH